MPSPDEKDPGKYSISFGGPTNIGSQHIGDVTTNHYNPVSTITITIDDKYFEQISQEYKESLSRFLEMVNTKLQAEKVPPAQGALVQTAVNDLVEATGKLKEVGDFQEKRKTIRDRLGSVAVALVKMSPTIARTLVGFTPLAPFSGLVGDSFEHMIQAALQSS